MEKVEKLTYMIDTDKVSKEILDMIEKSLLPTELKVLIFERLEKETKTDDSSLDSEKEFKINNVDELINFIYSQEDFITLLKDQYSDISSKENFREILTSKEEAKISNGEVKDYKRYNILTFLLLCIVSIAFLLQTFVQQETNNGVNRSLSNLYDNQIQEKARSNALVEKTLSIQKNINGIKEESDVLKKAKIAEIQVLLNSGYVNIQDLIPQENTSTGNIETNSGNITQ